MASCGFTYYVGGTFDDRNLLVCTPAGIVRDPAFYGKAKRIKALVRTEATAIDNTTDGTRMRTEFQKPRLRPSQLRPVQAVAQAFAHGSKVTSTGGEKMLPSRISGMPFSEVTIIT